MTLSFQAPKGLQGALVPPPDKSITHRALIIAALADGSCRLYNPLNTGDCISTRRCLEALGVAVHEEQGGEYPITLTVEGIGAKGFLEPDRVLDAGNSGTTMRLLAGVLAGSPMYTVLSGDASLNARPMLRIVEPLRTMGADIRGREQGRFPPLTFLPGSGKLEALEYRLPIASAQVKSCLLLAALRARGRSRIGGVVKSRDHTERLFRFLGLPLRQEGEWLIVDPSDRIPAFEYLVPGDISSAAFFIAAALMSGRCLEIKQCGLNPSRLGFLEILKRMGAGIEIQQEGGREESWGTVRVASKTLRAIEVQDDEIPLLIDEIPLLAVLGAFAEGTTRVSGAGELRHKESDRLQAVQRLLAAVGGTVELREDGFVVEGPQRLRGGTVDPRGDHRIAMAAAVLSAGIGEAVRVEGFEAAQVSFPNFVELFTSLGGEVR